MLLGPVTSNQKIRHFHFDVQVAYKNGLEQVDITIPTLSMYCENGINKVDEYNYFAYLTEKLLQEIHDEALHVGAFAIPAITQFAIDKKIFLKVDRDKKVTNCYELQASRSHLLKALKYDYWDIQKACVGAIEFIDKQNNGGQIVEFPAITQRPSKIIERALQKSISADLKSLLIRSFGRAMENYLNSEELKNLTDYFREVYMNDDCVSVAVDRKNRRYATYKFDEAAMFLMTTYPSMVYLPRYNERGQAQCRFIEATVDEYKGVEYGFFETSNMNYRFVVPSINWFDADTSEPKFLPCIEFMDSILSSPNGELKNLHCNEMIAENLLVLSKQSLKRIEEFLRRVYVI